MQQTWLKWELNNHVLATTPNRPVSRRTSSSCSSLPETCLSSSHSLLQFNVELYSHFDVQSNVSCLSLLSYTQWIGLGRPVYISFSDIAGSKETGRLLFANSWSPSFGNGTTSNIFQEAGNTEDNNEWFTMSVNADKIHGKASLMIAIGTLSYPGTLFGLKGHNNRTILLISFSETA